MAISEAYTLSAVTVGVSELSIVSGTTALQTVTGAPGAYQLWLDLANLVKGDEFRVRMYETVLSGGTKRVATQWTVLGVQAELFVTPTLVLMNGWDFTLQRIAGADRAITGSIRRIS